MKILALESSAVACSACLTEDDFLIAQSYENSGMTHSVTLLPMAEELLKRAGVSEKEIDVFAVAAGPGSFTGVRIGVSACKGLRQSVYFRGHGLERGSPAGYPLPGDGRQKGASLQRPLFL